MKKPDNCREYFLDGITDAYFYPTKGAVLPIPSFVKPILSMNDCEMGTANLHIATTEGDNNYVVAEAMTVKVTSSVAGNGMPYTFEINATISIGKENIYEIVSKMGQQEHYIVLKNQDGTYYLLYTLSNTFRILASSTNQSNTETYTLTASITAMNDKIPITFKQD